MRIVVHSELPGEMWQHRTQGISNVYAGRCCNVGETTVPGLICDSAPPRRVESRTGLAVCRVAYIHGEPPANTLSRAALCFQRRSHSFVIKQVCIPCRSAQASPMRSLRSERFSRHTRECQLRCGCLLHPVAPISDQYTLQYTYGPKLSMRRF